MLTDAFLNFWNGLAKKNGKLKFRNRQEAAEFVRRISNESGGPNAKMIEMRRDYVAVKEKNRVSAQSRRSEVRAL